MALLLPLAVGLVLFLLADSVNAICCRIPGQGWWVNGPLSTAPGALEADVRPLCAIFPSSPLGSNHYAVASCTPYAPCIGCVTPMDGIIKANTLEELLKAESAGKRNGEDSLKNEDKDELVKKTNVKSLVS